jgi:hypothetical protein
LSGPVGIAIQLSPAPPRPPVFPSAPEASTWVMSLIGFAALGLAGFRRARSRDVSA